MNAFLAETRAVYQNILLNPQHYKKLRVVLGNESCDLDSAISALVYGFILHHEGIEDNQYKSAVLPLLNIPHDDLLLKTEVTYFLKANNINLDWVPTRGVRDLLDLAKVQGSLELTLVDHHNLSFCDEELRESVVEVIDHRPQHPDWLWSNLAPDNVTIRNVGSCCTLIAEKVKQRSPHLLTQGIARLLLGPILLDTINLSESAGRATPLDEEMVQYLERTLPIDRQEMFTELVKAKADVAHLTTPQLLRKDMKIIGGVPIAGVPILIADLKNRPDFTDSLTQFSKILNNAPIVLLMGVRFDGENVSRDLAFFGTDGKVMGAILEPLLTNKSPLLGLAEVKDHGVSHCRLFKQANVTATRKHIGPIVAKAASSLQTVKRCGLN